MIKFLESIAKIGIFSTILFNTVLCIISIFVKEPFVDTTWLGFSIISLTVLIKYLLIVLEDVTKSE
jgi:hypothetical protein